MKKNNQKLINFLSNLKPLKSYKSVEATK